MYKKIIECSLHEKELKKTIKQVPKMDRNKLLRDRIREYKDPETILVSAWHPKLSPISSTLKDPCQINFRIAILQISNFILT